MHCRVLPLWDEKDSSQVRAVAARKPLIELRARFGSYRFDSFSVDPITFARLLHSSMAVLYVEPILADIIISFIKFLVSRSISCRPISHAPLSNTKRR